LKEERSSADPWASARISADNLLLFGMAKISIGIWFKPAANGMTGQRTLQHSMN